MNEYYEASPWNYGVGSFQSSLRSSRQVDEARARIARFIGASDAREVAFTKNATEALNLVCDGLALTSGDQVVTTALEHQSNLIPWFRLATERGVDLRIVTPDPAGRITAESVEQELTDRTALVSITHVSNVIGAEQPVSDIARLLRSRNIPLLVDAAQSAGRIPVNVSEIGCDFMAFCGRKALFGPQGTGFLWARPERLAQLRPVEVGSRAGRTVGFQEWESFPPPYRFEAGVLNTSGVIGLGAAVALLEEIGLDRIRAHVSRLTARMLEGLEGIDGVTVYGLGSVPHQTGIVAWSLEGVGSDEVARLLDEDARIAVASGDLGSRLALDHLGVNELLRTSVHYFNLTQDVDVLVESVERLARRHARVVASTGSQHR